MVRDSAAKLHAKALLPAPQPFPVLPAWIFPTSRSPYIPRPHQGTEDASPELSPGTTHRSTGPGAQAGRGKRQTPISLTRLFPVLLLTQSSSFRSLRGSASLPHFIPTNVSPGKWEPETGTETRTVAREERGADFRGRQRAGEGDLNRHPEKDPPGRPSELRGQQS